MLSGVQGIKIEKRNQNKSRAGDHYWLSRVNASMEMHKSSEMKM